MSDRIAFELERDPVALVAPSLETAVARGHPRESGLLLSVGGLAAGTDEPAELADAGAASSLETPHRAPDTWPRA